MTLDAAFETFLGRLQLGPQQVERMNSAANTLSDRLRKHFGLPESDVFLQGSYANRTAIKPPPSADDGEYDVDLVVICAGPGDTPRDALQRMHEALEAIGYGDRIEDDGDRERPCIRLRYAPDDAGHFHVDVVPARRTVYGPAPLEVPRPAQGEWRPTAPQEYTQWCGQQGPEFAATVQELKRWRDETQSARQAIKSIVLQVLIGGYMPRDRSDAERVAGTLRGISNFLQQHPERPPAVPNPVLPTVENLTERWPVNDYNDFRNVVEQAATNAESALELATTNLPPSLRLWQDLLGEDFPVADGGSSQAVVPAATARVATLDPGEEDLLVHRRIRTQISGIVSMTTEVYRGTTNLGSIPANSPLDKGLDLYFRVATTTVPQPYRVFWKVKNCGMEAAAVPGGLRGGIYEDTGGPNPTKKETTKYTGTHYVEVYIVKDGVCCARAMQIVDIR
jgi:hypothetical protein